jgi:hypothetical protein
MGMGAYNELRIRNIELVITDIKEIDGALADPGDKAFHHAIVNIGFGKLLPSGRLSKTWFRDSSGFQT